MSLRPTRALALSLDEPPTDVYMASKTVFWARLYPLLDPAERGPRLPTRVRALGAHGDRALLGG